MNEDIFTGPAIVAYIIQQLKQRDLDKQVRKGTIQSISYLVSTETKIGYEYVYSGRDVTSQGLSLDIEFAIKCGIVTTSPYLWYMLEVDPNTRDLFDFVDDKIKYWIEKTADRYNDFNNKELRIASVIMYYVKELNVPIDKIPSVISISKSGFNMSQIDSVLSLILEILLFL